MGQTAQAKQDTKETPMEQLLADLQEMNSITIDLLSRVERVKMKFYGPEPESDGKELISPAGGYIQELRYHSNLLMGRLKNLISDFTALESI